MPESAANFTRCPAPPRVRGGPRLSVASHPPTPAPGRSGPGSAPPREELPGVVRGPLTISTWRGSSWLGGAGTENWIFLRSLGSMAGGVAGGAGVGGWRASRGPGLRSRLGFPALLGARRRPLAVRGEGEASGSRSDKNTARGEGRARKREGVAPARSAPGSRLPALALARRARCAGPPAPAASASGSPARGRCLSLSLASPSFPRSLRGSLWVSPPPSLSLPSSPRASVCLCLSPSLQVSPSGPSLGVPGPSPRPGTGARGLGGRAQGEVANEHREPCSPRAGRRVRSVSQDRGAGWGPPAVSRELEAALLMESSREHNGGRPAGRGEQGEGQQGDGTLTLTPSWPGSLEFHGEDCEVLEKLPPACHAVNGGVLESQRV